jgi:Nucleotidyl transferase AbiEii toxin, Type IV TA system
MTPRLKILPPPQREFWDELSPHVPRHFVLYGGTAVALRYGHRQSLDFDFFSSHPVSEDEIYRAMPPVSAAAVLQRSPDTLVVALPLASGEVKLSFFGGIEFGRVGDPDELPDRPAIAAPIDLLATKLKVIYQRVEAKDYLDIEVLLRSGLSLNKGIAAARALYGERINPLETAKAVAWFKDGGLEAALSATTRRFLEAASATLDPAEAARPTTRRSRALNAGTRNADISGDA